MLTILQRNCLLDYEYHEIRLEEIIATSGKDELRKLRALMLDAQREVRDYSLPELSASELIARDERPENYEK